MIGEKPKQMGRIVDVDQTENGMVLCSVQLPAAGGTAEKVPVGKPHAKVAWKPEPGWSVVVDYLDDGSPFISEVLSVPSKEFQMPDLAEGSMTFQFDDDTAITIDKDDSGDYTVDISGSGDVTVSGQNVTVESAESVAVEAADSVEVDGSDIALGPNGDRLVTDVTTSTDSDGNVTSVDTTKTDKTTAE